ncbi:hypothetical protein INT43_002034 [Umbelopsis isabellina]|uniref:60S acidic ribosomal protein P1 n=1 Tax=Mortierella isabellina TaxID=91625 RepID=A0A8H7UHC5_MORIS|nr:hypothetical protein INT43_002034 [Umbelopsis isabellina]
MVLRVHPSIHPFAPSLCFRYTTMSAEYAIVYAALILQDDGIEITADKLSTLVKAAGVEVEPVWFSLYAKALAGQDLNALLMNIGSAGAAGPAAAGGAAATGGAAEEAAVEEKEEEKEESDDDMGFGKITFHCFVDPSICLLTL